MSTGWAGKILRIDLTENKIKTIDIREYNKLFIGGRGVGIKMIYDMVDHFISPTDPENMICICPGVLTGTSAPSTSRMQIVGMGTNGLLANSGLGGFIPAEIKYAGYDLITIEGKANTPVYLYVNNETVELKDASHIWGMDVFETQKIIKNELNDSFQVAAIGKGGENQVKFGSVHTDWRSAAGRSGFGAIMGSKKLKAIAARGTRGVNVAKIDEFNKKAAEMRQYLCENNCAPLANRSDATLPQDWWKCGMLPIGNFEAADWEESRPSTPNELFDKYEVARHACMGCTRAENLTIDIPGKYRGGGKCTGMASVSSTVWNFHDWETALYSYTLINQYGLDVMSTMSCTSFLMELTEKGIIDEKVTDGILIKKGDKNSIISTIIKIGEQEGYGKLFKNGLIGAVKELGRDAEKIAMTVKGQELEPYEYRSYKQLALAAAVSSKAGPVNGISAIPMVRWFETSLGYEGKPPDEEEMKKYEKVSEKLYQSKDATHPLTYEKQGYVTFDQESRIMLGDILGQCKRTIPWMATVYFDLPAELFTLATGVKASEEDLLIAAQRAGTLERAFNAIKGINRQDDNLPDRFFEEPTPGGPFKGEVLDRDKFDKMLDEYYEAHGWDMNGIPKESTFKKYYLYSEYEYFKHKIKTKSEPDVTININD